MRRAATWALAAALVAGCGDSGGGGAAPPDGAAVLDGASAGDAPVVDGDVGSDGAPDAAAGGPFAVACTDTVANAYVAPTGLPAYTPARRGDVVRCAPDRSMTVAQIVARLGQLGVAGVTPTSAVRAFRVAYRTDRLSPAEGMASALVLVPDAPIAQPPPLVVFAHGTTGTGPRCLISLDPIDGTLQDEELGFALAAAASGYVVMVSDYAGYGLLVGSTPGWLLAEDEAHSILDGARAMRQLLPGAMLSDKVVIAGHSQGGHAALAAHAYAKGYGLGGTLAGVVAFAPPWWAAKLFGAILSPLAMQTTSTQLGAATLAFATMYFYTHGELYDGAGGGGLPFQASKRAAITQVMQNQCFNGLIAAMPSFGSVATDWFDTNFAQDIGSCAIADSCTQGAAPTWRTRFRNDRPPIDAQGAPLLVWQGGQDQLVTPALASCGFDKLKQDLMAASATTTLGICVDPGASHNSVVSRDAGWVIQWIGARTLGRPEPPACMGQAALGSAACPTTPSNVD